ncbi:MAG TPA: hypothetical protein VLQ80_08970 [Candidatus Saccharimonadia bacterium]|nr:hypothetical protein [Candidatus Saccharimonadia bacterium]
MIFSRPALICWGSVLCLLLCLCLPERAGTQGEAPRSSRRGVPSPAAPASTVTAPAKAPQPLSQNAKITLDQNGLSVDVQDQDLSAIVERVAELARIELRHPEGMPNRRVSIRFASLPVVNGLKRIFRAAEVPGYLLHTAKQGDSMHVQRIVFLPEEGTTVTSAGRGAQRAPQVVVAPPSQPPPMPPGVVPQPPPAPPQEEARADEGRTSGNVFDEIKSNAAARRLLSQMMHPNEQVRERAFEGLVRLVREDDKQRALMELLEPLMEDLGSGDQAAQDEAREEIRKLLSR